MNTLAADDLDDIPPFLRRSREPATSSQGVPDMPAQTIEATADIVDEQPGPQGRVVTAPMRRDVATLTPMDMLDRAVSSGAGIEVISKLMDLQERWDKNQARKAFDKAIAAAKAEIPVVIKNREGHTGKYADFAAIARVIDPLISKHGLTYRFRTVQDDKIRVTCILSHDDGHSEETTLAGPPDKSGSKNEIQALGSTLTYLQRYSLVQMLGIAVSNDDDGKSAGVGDTLTDEQVDALSKLIMETKSDLAKFLKWAKVEALSEIRAEYFDSCVKVLEQRKQGAAS